MPRLRHKVTGVVVNISDDLAASVAGQFEPVDAPKSDEKSTKSASKK
jgi:hypothetical protein